MLTKSHLHERGSRVQLGSFRHKSPSISSTAPLSLCKPHFRRPELSSTRAAACRRTSCLVTDGQASRPAIGPQQLVLPFIIEPDQAVMQPCVWTLVSAA